MNATTFSNAEIAPLASLDEWEDDLLVRYPDPDSIAQAKAKEEFRNYDTPARDTVTEFYRLNHKVISFLSNLRKSRSFSITKS